MACLRSQVRIPTRDYDINRSSNVAIQIAGRRVTCVAYNIEPSKTLQYLKIGTSLQVIPVLTRCNIDGAVAVVFLTLQISINLTLHAEFSTKVLAKVPVTFTWHKGSNGWSEPLIQEADPHIMKLAIEARMQDKDGQKKSSLTNIFLNLKLAKFVLNIFDLFYQKYTSIQSVHIVSQFKYQISFFERDKNFISTINTRFTYMKFDSLKIKTMTQVKTFY